MLCVAAYWPGLHGPFLFDDPPNIIFPIQAWLAGKTSWVDVILSNHAGALGRCISMATFVANASFGGLNPFVYKVTNLGIHLACGWVIYVLLSQLLLRDRYLGGRSRAIACAITVLWLLHPMQVSTVLYVVQRMAQLSAFFVLLSLLAYTTGRIYLERGRIKLGWLYLFILLPGLVTFAALSKENGLLAPLFCAVIELGYFAPVPGQKRPRASKLFLALFLVCPAAFAVVLYGIQPQRITAGYDNRLFTLSERLLSEPRALLDYMGALLHPRGPALGVYTDDFPVSHGLFDPPSTLFAICALIALITAAWILRRRSPAFFVGVGMYLAGHAMESTVFPLELYFEHRNYLPSVGFFLALAGLAAWGYHALATRTRDMTRPARLLGAGFGALILLLGAATWARASVWSSWYLIAQEGVRTHPQSMRAKLDLANLLQVQGQYSKAEQVFKDLATSSDPTAQHVAAIDTIALQCMAYGTTSQAASEHIRKFAGAKLQLADLLALENLGHFLQTHQCQNLSRTDLASAIVELVDQAPQPARLTQLWRNRFVASQLYIYDGNLTEGVTQAALAWSTGAADPSIGIYLANLYWLQGNAKTAEKVLAESEKRIKRWDERDLEVAGQLRRQFQGAASLQPAPN